MPFPRFCPGFLYTPAAGQAHGELSFALWPGCGGACFDFAYPFPRKEDQQQKRENINTKSKKFFVKKLTKE